MRHAKWVTEHSSRKTLLSISPDGSRLATGIANAAGYPLLWRVAADFSASAPVRTVGQALPMEVSFSATTREVLFSGDGWGIYSADDGAYLYGVPPPPGVPETGCWSSTARFSTSGRWLAIGKRGAETSLVARNDLHEITVLPIAHCESRASFNRDDSLVAMSGPEVYRTSDWSLVWPAQIIAEPPRSGQNGIRDFFRDAQFAPGDQALLVSQCDVPAGVTGCAHELRAVSDGAVIQKLPEINGTRARFSGEGNWIVSGNTALHVPTSETVIFDPAAALSTFAPNGDIIAVLADSTLARYCRTPQGRRCCPRDTLAGRGAFGKARPMGVRQNSPLGLYLHLETSLEPGFPRVPTPLRLVLPGPIGTATWNLRAGAHPSAHPHLGGSNPRLERFKKALIAMQVRARQSEHPPKRAVIKLEDSELRLIDKTKQMHKDVAPLFQNMWTEVRAAHKARTGSTASDSIGIASAYRSAERDMLAWQHAFPKYYSHTLEARQATGDEFGTLALHIVYRYMNGKKAPPGFSGHTRGIAVDLTTKEKGQTWTVNSDHSHQVGWQKTWLYGWLVENAWKHKFYQLKSETWHWEYHQDDPPRQCWGGHVKHRPVSKEK